MKLRKVKHLISKGRYCYEWVNVQTGETRECPFLKKLDVVEDLYEHRCTLIKEDIFDEIKMCGIKQNY
jgi:hypothetical protein